MPLRRPILIAGPTASGKSALALRLAERDRGCVINADAAQVYACWRILTARPDQEHLRRAPHALYGHVPHDASYSVGAWLRDLKPVLEDLANRDLRPIVVGGTGLYMTALTEGLAEIPAIPAEVRRRSSEVLASGNLDVFRNDLAERDPETLARIDIRNPMRLQRAWEVLMTTGIGLAAWHRTPANPLLDGADCDCVLLHFSDKSLLNNAIDLRFRKMVQDGALQECRGFLAAGGNRSSSAGQILGAPEFFAHLAGNCSLDEAIARAVRATQRYAKRQRTWFRNRMTAWRWMDPLDQDLLPLIPSD